MPTRRDPLPRKMMRMPLRDTSAAILFAVLLTTCAGKDGAQPARNGPIPVSVVTLKPQDVTLTREFPGRAVAYLVADVRPQVSGIIEKRLFREGTFVQAGEPLYQIEDRAYRAEYERARAAVARAKATVETARLNYKRSAELVKIDAVSTQDFEDATTQARQAEADLAASQAALRSAAVTLGYARITSPISGRIGRSTVTPGALVIANQSQALATVQQLDPMNVDINAPSNEFLQLRRQWASGKTARADLPVKILLEDGSRYEHEGKLAFDEVSVDPTTGSFAVRVRVANPEQLLMAGMYVRAIIAGGVRPNALLVPQRAVIRNPNGSTIVMLVGADGKVEQRSIAVSQTIGAQWLVEDGLAPGDRVIVEGLQKVRPGAPVQATEMGATSPKSAGAPPQSAQRPG